MRTSLILVGLRGAGKTTLGRTLAERTGLRFLDADRAIEAAAGLSVAELFARHGEGHFRALESAQLADCVARGPLVLATGGGAVLREANRRLLRGAGFVVWLTASPGTLWHRVQADAATPTQRPPLTDLAGAEELAHLLAARRHLYAEVAHATISTEPPSPESLLETILEAWAAFAPPPPQ